MSLDISKIVQHNLSLLNYYTEEHPKTQIFIHHTAGGSSGINTIDGFKARKDKVATAFVIAGKPPVGSTSHKDGDIIQAFSSKCWAYHLGLKTDVFKKFGLPYQSIDKISIAIEICNWGAVKLDAEGNYRNYVNGIVAKEDVIELDTPYRETGGGGKFWHKYSDAQLLSLRDLLTYLCERYNIPKTYHEEMWDVNKNALIGIAGIWTHTSVRYDKIDCYPLPALVGLLQNLTIKNI